MCDQAKAEFEAVMKTVSDEKNRMLERRQQMEKEEEDTREKRREMEKDLKRVRGEEERQVEVGMLQKAKSEDVMELHRVSLNVMKLHRVSLNFQKEKNDHDHIYSDSFMNLIA